jgi:hypothetical protein
VRRIFSIDRPVIMGSRPTGTRPVSSATASKACKTRNCWSCR